MRARLSGLAASAFLLAGCAGAPSGVGATGAEIARLEPSKDIGAGALVPESLVGVAPDALAARLGVPAFRRREPAAEVWQYAGEGCSLFVYFYKTDAGVLASSYVDARARTGGAADPAACLAEVMAKRGAPVS